MTKCHYFYFGTKFEKKIEKKNNKLIKNIKND